MKDLNQPPQQTQPRSSRAKAVSGKARQVSIIAAPVALAVLLTACAVPPAPPRQPPTGNQLIKGLAANTHYA